MHFNPDRRNGVLRYPYLHTPHTPMPIYNCSLQLIKNVDDNNPVPKRTEITLSGMEYPNAMKAIDTIHKEEALDDEWDRVVINVERKG